MRSNEIEDMIRKNAIHGNLTLPKEVTPKIQYSK